MHRDAIKRSCHLAILMGLAHVSSARRKRDLAAMRPSHRLNPGRDKRLLLSAIGQCLKAQYHTLAAPIPLAALVKQLEKQKRR
jgi:hypothetical protein